ncbi:MAG: glycosyltransferase family 2 protein [Microbacter sp.]
MSHLPHITICIITYNQEQYIEQAVESVLAQQYEGTFNIILSDDHSTDRTADICRHYREQYPDRIQFIQSQKNQGVVSNWIQALAHAHGEYIALLEGDDFWNDPTKIQKQSQILDRFPDVGFVFTDFYYQRDNQTTRMQGMPHYHLPENLFDETLFDQQILSSSVLFRRSLTDSYITNLILQNQYLTADLPFFLYFCLQSNGYFLPEITTIYRWKNGSVSRPVAMSEQLRMRRSIYQIRLFFIAKRGMNKKHLHAKNEFTFHKEELFIYWQFNEFQHAKETAKIFNRKMAWEIDKKTAIIILLSQSKICFRIFRPYITRKRTWI